ncbi:MAG: BufA2 family periplasmic bufferin-type metallophore [Gammaproteobacteria bacterium]
MNKTTGLALATAAAALFASGTTSAEKTPAAGSEAKVRCDRVNKCGGLSQCKTPANAGGKGQNKCAAQGMLFLTRAECEAARGTPLDSADPIK